MYACITRGKKCFFGECFVWFETRIMSTCMSTSRSNYTDMSIWKKHADHSTSGYSNLFCKNLNQRSLIPRWPLTPHLLMSHVWLYPRIIVFKSHENTSKYVDTVTLFAKTWTKGHWPLDDVWPHICWGHMCDSTQGSLCPSPMGIHQCMWIQWSILQITTYEGQKFLATIFFLFTRVHLYKGGSIYIKYEPLSFMPYINSVARLVALRH